MTAASSPSLRRRRRITKAAYATTDGGPPARPYFRLAVETVRPEFYAAAGEVVDAAAGGTARIRRSPGPAGGAGVVTQLRRGIREDRQLARDVEREVDALSADERPERR